MQRRCFVSHRPTPEADDAWRVAHDRPMARRLRIPALVFINDLTNADSLPTLTAAVSFAGQRQKVIAHNIANLSTPNFRPVDVSIPDFQDSLRDAIDARRERWGGQRGGLHPEDTRTTAFSRSNAVTLEPRPTGRNVLFHDRNDRDLERTMQDLAENVAAFRVSTDLFRTRMGLLKSAIRETP